MQSRASPELDKSGGAISRLDLRRSSTGGAGSRHSLRRVRMSANPTKQLSDASDQLCFGNGLAIDIMNGFRNDQTTGPR